MDVGTQQTAATAGWWGAHEQGAGRESGTQLTVPGHSLPLSRMPAPLLCPLTSDWGHGQGGNSQKVSRALRLVFAGFWTSYFEIICYPVFSVLSPGQGALVFVCKNFISEIKHSMRDRRLRSSIWWKKQVRICCYFLRLCLVWANWVPSWESGGSPCWWGVWCGVGLLSSSKVVWDVWDAAGQLGIHRGSTWTPRSILVKVYFFFF